jgi:hypothetical protein
VPCAELWILHRERRAAGQRGLDLLATFADHHHRSLRLKLREGRKQVLDHRPAGERVEHLVPGALHPRALACGEDHRGERAGGRLGTFGHAAPLPSSGCGFQMPAPRPPR